MDASFSAEDHFRRGQEALESQRHTAALEHFRSAHRLDPAVVRYRSYYGLCVALAERRLDRALELCRSAAKEEFFDPAHYRNLAHVHMAFGLKAEAIRYLRRGLTIDPDHGPILEDLRNLGVRRLPVLAFLPRRHALNRCLGRLLAGPRLRWRGGAGGRGKLTLEA
ncbi:MAG: hypothetical protein V3U03_00695 [Myxococcota bacterium]